MNVIILLLGLAVYAGYGISGLLVLLGATLLSYGTALATKRIPAAMWLSVCANIAVLLLFRGQHLAGLELTAPMGLSYFSLMLISYNVDVYRGKYPAEKNLFRFASYVTYLPHLFMGPIEGYDRLSANLFENRRVTWNGIAQGAARLLWGLFKKLVIAARAGVIISAIASDTSAYRGGYALAAMILYSVQLYCDFSGGIDMALGVSRMLGITMSENFDAPFLSQSVQEFWRRWHITLGLWLRNYVYIPLGGNRKGKVRKFINTLVTFLVSGLWHGSGYLLWGALNGLLVAAGDKLKTKYKLLNRMFTFLLISLLWCFYVWPDTMTALDMLGSVFTVMNYGTLISGIAAMGLTAGDWIVFAVAAVLLGVCDGCRTRCRECFDGMNPAAKTAVICSLALSVLIFGMYGIGFNASEFIYSQF